MLNRNFYPAPLLELIDVFRSIPGVGPQSQERLVSSVYRWNDEKLFAFSESLRTLHSRVCPCVRCGNLAEKSEDGLCSICKAPNRDNSVLCIVEDAFQLMTIEACGAFKGVYHILGGRLSPIDGKNLESIHVEKLEDRVKSEAIGEMILALGADVEGQATSVYIANLFKNRIPKITRLAQGLPSGASLNYVDAATMSVAFNGRVNFD